MDWATRAVCRRRGIDPETFFPLSPAVLELASAICGGCDVRERCLAYALDNGQEHGVWGGLAEAERRAERAPARPDTGPDRLTGRHDQKRR